ncbi:hypothetical protein LUZ62_014726 [Rhynchospora pubera]|uniref:Ubiquitin-like protease family profile domain-containing protein n=1 Tax=Rhynchospora pubera TaxID=906938 RepID=A0AAV8G907_9POAL|nr:hypothetical protein LUZ62_014726 [Rhynchospora pubera]
MIIPSKVGDKVHHEPLEPGQVKINVDEVLDGYRRWTVPFPLSDGTDRLGELMGNYLRWHASLVELCEKDITPSKPPQKKANTKVSSAMSDNGREPLLADIYLQRLGKQCNLLYNVLMAQPPDDYEFDVAFSEFNYEGILKVNLVDILEVLKKEWVNISILKIFCMVHWVLLIIQISGPTVYVVDSLNPIGAPKLEIKTALDTALRHYWMHQNKNKRGTRFHWVKIESPKQPDGNQCGYYVMRSMVNIINEYHTSINLPSVLSPGPAQYEDNQIDEVREMFAEFMRRII